jgi:uncharacterized iron-regulated membrane protein
MQFWKRFKAAAAWLHLWLGLATGIVIIIISITGCVLVFEDELFDFFHRDLVEVKQAGQPKVVSELMTIAQHTLGKSKPITDIRINEEGRSYVFSASKINKAKDITLSYFSQFKYRDDVYVNPYNGKVLGVIDMRYEFFNVTEQLHRQLLLVKPVGSVIIGCCVLVFLVMLVTGFILWLPRNLRQLKKSISIKWAAKWKRVNYDLHNSLGFYVLPIAIVIAVTGLTWSFKWWEKGIYQMLGSKKPVVLVRKAPPVTTADTTGNNLDLMVTTLRYKLKGNYRVIGLNLPDKGGNTMMAFVYLKTPTDGWRNLSYYYFDNRTGKLFDQLEHAKKPLGLKWRNSNKDIHTGRIYGLRTQLPALLASLVCASLPVTGFLIWWGKRKKKKTRVTSRVTLQ